MRSLVPLRGALSVKRGYNASSTKDREPIHRNSRHKSQAAFDENSHHQARLVTR
jgi:hypothetical protein